MANRARKPGESFHDYRLSLAIEYLNDKANRRGRCFHVSKRLNLDHILNRFVPVGPGITYNNGRNAAKRARRHAL